jgi:hypothetical protein
MTEQDLMEIEKAKQLSDYRAQSYLGLFEPTQGMITSEYLVSHEILDAVRDFSPQVGRFSSFGIHPRELTTVFELTDYDSSHTVSPTYKIDVERKIREVRDNALKNGFTVGRTEGSRRALQSLRNKLRNDAKNKNRNSRKSIRP